jgi:putative transposase
MKTYSPDLRRRVVAAVRDSDVSQAKIATVFSVSLGTVENWWRSWQATGRTAPLPHAGGTKRTLQPYAAQIRQAVQQHPDATLEELCAVVEAATQVHTTPSMMCRELHILNLPRKKSHCTTVSAIPRACNACAKRFGKRFKPRSAASPPI